MKFAIICSFVLLVHELPAQPTFTSFDPPGSVLTNASAVDNGGSVAGTYNDSTGATHGFLRDSIGVFTSFNLPDDGIPTVTGMNSSAGVVVGSDLSPENAVRGFVMSGDGKIALFQVPGATTGPVMGTWALDINAYGAVAGYINVGATGASGFVRSGDGDSTVFSVPGEAYTVANGINAAGIVTGNFTDQDRVNHGFIRAANGDISTFDAPLAGLSANQGTFGWKINAAGTVAGYYIDSDNRTHGLVLTVGGVMSTFDGPDVGTFAGGGTYVKGLNAGGAVAGWYLDTNRVGHAYIRSSTGRMTVFNAPDDPMWTEAQEIANSITGNYSDTGGHQHGFVLVP